MHRNVNMHVLSPCGWWALKHTSDVQAHPSDAHNINACMTGCLMYDQLLEGVVVDCIYYIYIIS